MADSEDVLVDLPLEDLEITEEEKVMEDEEEERKDSKNEESKGEQSVQDESPREEEDENTSTPCESESASASGPPREASNEADSTNVNSNDNEKEKKDQASGNTNPTTENSQESSSCTKAAIPREETSAHSVESPQPESSVQESANKPDDQPQPPTASVDSLSVGSSVSDRLPSDSDDLSSSYQETVTVEVISIPRDLQPLTQDAPESRTATTAPEEIVSGSGSSRREEQEEEEEETTTTVEETHTVERSAEPGHHTDRVEMSDQQRVEEKLKQFQNDAKEQEKDKETRQKMDDTVQITEAEKRRRNLIFDEERFEETFLKCLICREVYNETDKLPKMLHCHHTFCLDCLFQMYRVEGEFRQSLTSVFRNMPMTVKIQCPTCREGLIISEPELRRLPNDHTIMELLCFVNKTGKNDIQYCPKHQMQPLNFFCEPCIMPVCCDCTVLDHKESKGHRVVNVDEAMEKYTPIVEDTLTDIRKEKSTLATKREALENTQQDLNQIQDGITDQIRKVFDSIREVLDERERELHDVAQSEVERKHAVLQGHLNTIEERESDLNVEFNSLQAAKDDRDISLIFTGHKSARDLLARKVYIPTNSTAGFSITFQFSSRADTVIKQQVANLGDIIFHS